MFDTIYAVLGVPFGYVLKFIYDTVDNYGVALILFTLFARILMLPTTITQQKGAAKTQRLSPKIRRINEKYAGDQRKIQEETQLLYQREGYNPMSAGCMPLLIQMPIIFGLIGVIYHPLKYALQIDDASISALTTAVTEHFKELGTQLNATDTRTIELRIIENIAALKGSVASGAVSQRVYDKIAAFDFEFLGIPLGQTPQMKVFNNLWAIPILSGLSSLASGVFTMIKQKQQNPQMAKNPSMGCMTLGMPLFSLYFTFQFPAGIGIYWIASNIFAFFSTVIISFTHSPKKLITKAMVEETIVRRSKEANTKRVKELQDSPAVK